MADLEDTALLLPACFALVAASVLCVAASGATSSAAQDLAHSHLLPVFFDEIGVFDSTTKKSLV